MTTILTVAFRAKPEQLAEFHALLAQAKCDLPGTRGCRDFRILSGSDDPTAIMLVETWVSRDAHQAHIADVVASGGWASIASHLAADPVQTSWTET